MNDHLIHDWQHISSTVQLISLVVVAMATALCAYFIKQRSARDIAAKVPVVGHGRIANPDRLLQTASCRQPTHDTLFILADISHYTRFMMSKALSASEAQNVVFSLLNALMEAAGTCVSLSKIEGDAVLFFADGGALGAEKAGGVVADFYEAFYRELGRLVADYEHDSEAAETIGTLDLKIFIHRGQTARFEFKGIVDHFGADVIILHRLMKNGALGNRYVMITDAAAASVTLAGARDSYRIQEALEHYGSIEATVFPIYNPVTQAWLDHPVLEEVQ